MNLPQSKLVWLTLLLGFGEGARNVNAEAPSDLIVHNARVVTVDPQFRIAQAVAVRKGRIQAVGDDAVILKLGGPETRVIDARGRTVLPGLYDSHVHPLGAATSELIRPVPLLRSLKDVFAHIRARARTTPEGEWIVLYYAFPTRLDEARFPTRAELDEAAPKHPVLYHAGPAGIVNSLALKVSGITKDTPNPPGGVIVKDTATGEPTGMLRGSYRPLKGLPAEEASFSAEQKRAALKSSLPFTTSKG